MTRKTITQRLLILLVGGLLAVLTGCARNATPSNNQEPTIVSGSEKANVSDSNTLKLEDKDAQTSNSSEPTEAVNNDVVLFVYGNENANEREFILSGEDAQLITDLFYVHEKEIHSSPCDSLYDFEFQIGADNLGTTQSLGILDGRVGGEFVTMRLSEDESEALRSLISQYVQDIS